MVHAHFGNSVTESRKENDRKEKLKKELGDLDKTSNELTNLTREKQVIECDYYIALCEEELQDFMNKTKTLKMC